MRTLFLVLGLMLSIAFAGAEQTRKLLPQELKGIRLWGPDNYRITSIDGSTLAFTCQPRFKNETRNELATITIRMVVKRTDGRTIYASEPHTIYQFDNFCLPHSGSLLPYEKSDIVRPIRFLFASNLWTTQSSPELQFLGASTFVNPNLHDYGHLYSFFFNTHDDQVIAAFKKDPTLVKVKNSRGMTATLGAFSACGVPVVKYLLAHGGTTAPSTGGSTIMHMAALNGNPGMLDFTLKLGGKVNARTKPGNTPLVKAIAFGFRDGWRWLLAHKADPNIPDANGLPPAYTAIFEGQPDAITDLAKAGARIKQRDREGRGWVEYAVLNEYMFNRVFAAGLSANAPDPGTGRTPLMFAAQIGYTQAIALLLRHGANPDARDRKGWTAYDYARLSNTLNSDQFLRDLVERNRQQRRL